MLHLFGYLYYWQMGFNSVFRGLIEIIQKQWKCLVLIKTSQIYAYISVHHERKAGYQKWYCAILLSLNSVKNYKWFFFLIFCWLCISIYLFLNINQLDALNFRISLLQACTCLEHMCSSSGGQNCIIQSLLSSHWNKWMV